MSLLFNMNQRYEHSTLVEVPDIKPEPCFTRLPVRCHKDSTKTSQVYDEVFSLWREYIGNIPSERFSGSRNEAVGSFESLVLPEANPERLRYPSWLTEFFFYLDG